MKPQLNYTIHSATLSTGVKLHYVEQGNADGLPVLLLHGYSDSWHSFERLLPLLPASIRAIAITQRGHGDADRPLTGYRTTDFAADAVALMDKLNLERAVLVGHSMGSLIAQRFALEYPERTRGLALVGAFTTLQNNADVTQLREIVAALTDPVDPAFVREFQQGTLARTVPPVFFETVVRESLKLPARCWRSILDALMSENTSDEISRINAPALIIWGDQDVFSPRRDQQELAANIADTQFVIYSGTGHSPHWEKPERFAADLLTFVNGLAETNV